MTKSGFIAIVGRPNAGKSTLLNAILGAKVSIVTPKAQTTRERVLGILTEKEGQIVFVDTPGIHNAKEGGINAFMMSEAREALDAPSAVWYLVDPASALKHEEAVLKLLEKSASPVFLLMNKMDCVRKGEIENLEAFETQLRDAMSARKIPLKRVLKISAEKKTNLNELLKESWSLLPEGPLYFPPDEQGDDQLSDRPTRFFVAEKIREQLLLQLGEEIPYSCAVEIDKFEEPKVAGDITRIEAVIHVERDSQKGIVVGKGGLKIKNIGMHARRQIEDFLGGKVFLGLKVKVLKDWTKNAEALKRMGYHLPESK